MIAVAFEKGDCIYLYDIKGKQLSLISLNGGSLISFTAYNVNILNKNYIYIYNERGVQTGMLKV
jgi:hypothetical protein